VIPVESIATRHRDEDIHLVDLMQLIWASKYLVIFITVVVGAAAAVFAWTATPVYEAEVVVTEVHEGNMGGGSSLASQLGGLASAAGVSLPLGGNANHDAQALLKSRHLIEEFIQRNNLLPVLSPGSKQPLTLWKGVQRFGRTVLTIKEDPRQAETTIIVDWTDPATAARWANGIVALANELVRTRAFNESTRNVTYLKEQIAKTDNVELQRVMYNLIQSETKTLMLANARQEYAFTVIDRAVPPEERARPKRTLIVAFGLLGGFLAGTIVVFARERLRPRVKRS
jgi:uncharacterized protein involved in exopolysaccharide biosynthesis